MGKSGIFDLFMLGEVRVGFELLYVASRVYLKEHVKQKQETLMVLM